MSADAVPMTSRQRDEFVRLAKQYVRAMKADGDLRAAQVVEAFETEISALYSSSDDRWAEAVEMVNEAARSLNSSIAEHFQAMGLNPDLAPGIDVGWRGRSWQASDKERRAELRAQAKAQADVVKKKALATAERLALEVEKDLLVNNRSLEEAQALMKSLPPVEDLMPQLNVERIEAIARAADKKANGRYYRLWNDSEPLLTGKPMPNPSKKPRDIGELPWSVHASGRYVKNVNEPVVEEVDADAVE